MQNGKGNVPRLRFAIGYHAADNLNVLKLVSLEKLSLFFIIRGVFAGRDGAGAVIELPKDVGGFDLTLLNAGCERNLDFLLVTEFSFDFVMILNFDRRFS